MTLRRSLYYRFALLGVALCLGPAGGLSQVVHNDDVQITGSACVGDAACSGHTPVTDLDIVGDAPAMRFINGSVPNVDFDWEVQADGAVLTFTRFDKAFLNPPVPVVRFGGGVNAEPNSLFVSSFGNVGLGTSTPVDLQVTTDSDFPRLRLEHTGMGTGIPTIWDVTGGTTHFSVINVLNGQEEVFRINYEAPRSSLILDADGHVGMAGGRTSFSPNAPLHVWRNSGTARILVEEDMFSTTVRDLLHLDNPGPVGFRMTDSGLTPADWRVTARGSSGGQFSIDEINTGGGPELIVQANGDLAVTGRIFTASPRCRRGCDEVFDPGYEIEPIEDHAAEMWEKRHLPAVGPTTKGESIDLTEKVGGVLNELEKAHIYIERLNDQLTEERQHRTSLEDRLARLEARLDTED